MELADGATASFTMSAFSKSGGRELLARWEEIYLERLRPKLLMGRYSIVGGKTLQDLLSLIRLHYPDGRVIAGGDLGASLLTGEIRPEKVTLHINEAASKVMSALKLRPDPEGNVTLLEVFGQQNAWNNHKDGDITVAEPLFIHAELMLLGGERIRTVAERIYDDYLLTGAKHAS